MVYEEELAVIEQVLTAGRPDGLLEFKLDALLGCIPGARELYEATLWSFQKQMADGGLWDAAVERASRRG
jgi:hypothetical protein